MPQTVVINSVVCSAAGTVTVIGDVQGFTVTATVPLGSLTGSDAQKQAVLGAALVAACPTDLSSLKGTVSV